jgi:hypothetical protein
MLVPSGGNVGEDPTLLTAFSTRKLALQDRYALQAACR